MSIISQIMIIVLALFILVILVRANRDLEQAAMEGEHFVDSWAMAQEKLVKKKEIRAGKQEEIRYEEEEEIIWPQEEKRPAPPDRDELCDHYILEAFDEIYQTTRRARVEKVPFYIGRGKDNDMILDDLSVARKHAFIHCVDGHCVLEDQGSMGGIITNGNRVRKVRLTDGLLFYLGNTQIRVKSGSRRKA